MLFNRLKTLQFSSFAYQDERGGFKTPHRNTFINNSVENQHFKDNCYSKIKYYQLVTILSLFIISGLFGGQIEGTDRISLMTEDFNIFRRIVLTIPTMVNAQSIVNPQVSADSISGEFTINLSPVDTGLYVGKRLYKAGGNYPIRLKISFPDSQSLLITGKTIQFEKIVRYYILDEGQFIFDIYKEMLFETYFRERTIALSSTIQDFKTIQPIRQNEYKIPTLEIIRQSKLNRVRDRINKAVSVSGIIVVSGIIIISFVFFGRRTFIVRRIQQQSDNEDKTGKELSKESSSKKIGSEVYMKEVDVRQLMEIQGISYDEAVILKNVSQKGSLNIET